MLKEEIAPFLEDLWYPSESDEPIAYVCRPWQTGSFTVETFKEVVGIRAADLVEEKDSSVFWSPVCSVQPWFTEEEVARVGDFNALKALLESCLVDVHYFYVGQKVVDIYVVGFNVEGQLEGIVTKAVYT